MSEQSQVCEEPIMSIEIQKIKQKIASMQNGEVQLSPPLEPDYIKPWSFLKEHTLLVPKEGDSPWIHPILTGMNGSLPLLARPKSLRQGQLFLILNGAFRGQIWSANQVELIPKVDHKFANGNTVNTLNFLLAYSQGKY